MIEPLVTIVISARESHWPAEQSLQTVLADDAAPFALIYLDMLSPPAVAQMIQGYAQAHNFKVIRHDQWIAPATARKLALGQVKTRYVAFVDNDVLVERGCLERLVACAEETGAAVVGPLYLQAGADHPVTIHMAGGELAWTGEGDRALISEGHRLLGESIEQAAALTREPVDFLEYHYCLARTDLLKRPGALSDDILLVHEHIDLALFAREQGLSVWMEPAARVTYLAFRPQRLQDLAFYRRRWDFEACEDSLRAFGRRWPVADESGMYDPVRQFVRGRLAAVEFAREGPVSVDLAQPMTPAELAQTRCALREQAIARDYAELAVQALEAACDFATLIFDGMYRPDGRPFLNHAIGTASALIRYELRSDIVVAGLLHAAYTHRPDWMAQDEVSRVLTSGGVERLVREQSDSRVHTAAGNAAPERLTVHETEGLCIRAANEADMRLSGEYRATGRAVEFTETGLALVAGALAYIGRDGLAATAAHPIGVGAQDHLFGFRPVHGSFRLDAKNRRLDWVRTRA
ncbi:MAG TPA: glycosyltransferase [Caulobacteraceae bacterium]